MHLAMAIQTALGGEALVTLGTDKGLLVHVVIGVVQLSLVLESIHSHS